MRALAVLIAALPFLPACRTSPKLPDPEPTHPASPQAEEAPERAPSTTLRMPERVPRGSRTGKGH